MVKGIFKDFVIASAGPLDTPNEKLSVWTGLRKGRFALEMEESVTHLLCTTEQLGRRHKFARIREAERRGKRAVHVVHEDWFIFSCTKNKKLPERKYSLDAVREREREGLRRQREAERRARNTMLGETWINPDLYHVFTDKFHFRYEIQLFRTLENQDGVSHEKYELYLFESHAKPPLYWFGAKLFQKKETGAWRPRGIERTGIAPSRFKTQFMHFKNFFQLKTKIDWPDRVLKAGTGEKTDFSYSPPTRGKPVGGNLTTDLDYDECVRRNLELRLLWAELFGDGTPVDVMVDAQVHAAAKAILENIIDEACAFLECESLFPAMHTCEDNVGVSNEGIVHETRREQAIGPGEPADREMEICSETGADGEISFALGLRKENHDVCGDSDLTKSLTKSSTWASKQV